MTATDGDAKWLQMTWIFYYQKEHWTNERIKAFLRAVPQGKMILLDYFCDNTEIWKTTESFYGQPYIWCYLGNFGGNTMMAGDVEQVEDRMENAFRHGGNNLSGVGSTLEGFGVNPMMYEFVFDKVWHNGNTGTDKWISDWASRRYGKADSNVIAAWKIISHTAYAAPGGFGQATLTNSRPVMKGFQSWTTDPKYNYDNKQLLQAWQLLNSADSSVTDVYKTDLVTVGRQVLGNYFKDVRDHFAKAYDNKDLTALNKYGDELMSLINDMDALLATDKNELLGNWIAMARAMGKDKKEKDYFEKDAKRIVTVWGQQGRTLVDYANRSWAGLMKSYYGARWQMFINDVTAAVKSNHKFDPESLLAKEKIFEENWVSKPMSFASLPKENSVIMSKKLYNRYAMKIMAE